MLIEPNSWFYGFLAMIYEVFAVFNEIYIVERPLKREENGLALVPLGLGNVKQNCTCCQ